MTTTRRALCSGARREGERQRVEEDELRRGEDRRKQVRQGRRPQRPLCWTRAALLRILETGEAPEQGRPGSVAPDVSRGALLGCSA